MRITFTLFLIFVVNLSVGQIRFEKTFGMPSHSEYGYDIVQLNDSSYLMIGLSSPDSLRLLKFSPQGDLIWNHGIDRAPQTNIFKLNDNEFYLSDPGAVRKIDSLGNSLWFRSYISNEVNGRLNPCYDLGYVSTGELFNFHAFGIYRHDSSAALIKSDTIRPDTVYTYWMLGVKELMDKNYIVIAEKNNDSLSLGLEFFKIDTLGAIVWRRNISRDSLTVKDFITLPDSGFVISGVQPLNNFKIFLKRFDKYGNMIGDFEYLYGCGLYRFQIQQTVDAGFVIGCDQGLGGTDLLVLKINSAGNYQWHKTFGTTHFDNFGSLRQTFDNGYIICGSKFISGNNQDYYLIKTDSLGDVNSTSADVRQIYSNLASVNIFPNPATQIATIEGVNLQGKEARIQLYDRIGTLLTVEKNSMIQSGNLLVQMSIDNLAAGLYYLQLLTEKETLFRPLIVY